MKRVLALFTVAFAALLIAACGGGGGPGYGNLVATTHPQCQSEGQAVANYLNTGSPASMASQWGDQRQMVRTVYGGSGDSQSRALYIRQLADGVIESCDEQQAEGAPHSGAARSSPSTGSTASRQQTDARYLEPACSQAGGKFSASVQECQDVPYYGTNGHTYYTTLLASGNALMPFDPASLGSATQSECSSGSYPIGPSGPIQGTPGHWSYGLCLVN